jgi:hypothetical protein
VFLFKENLVKSCIKQALAFNPDKQKVSNVEIPHDPKFHIGSQYGTPHQKQMYFNSNHFIYQLNFFSL